MFTSYRIKLFSQQPTEIKSQFPQQQQKQNICLNHFISNNISLAAMVANPYCFSSHSNKICSQELQLENLCS